MSRVSNLQAALSQTAGRKAAKPATGEPFLQNEPAAAEEGRAPSRRGKVNVSAWLPPDYKRSLRMVQAVTDKKIEPLIAEALNDLFAKYNVPQIRSD